MTLTKSTEDTKTWLEKYRMEPGEDRPGYTTKCDCCGQNVALDHDPAEPDKNFFVGVASIPGIPMSIGWCKECLAANAIPLWVAIANYSMGGAPPDNVDMEISMFRDDYADFWIEIIDATLEYFKVPEEEFWAQVWKEAAEEEDIPEIPDGEVEDL